MKNAKDKERFIELRAEGRSYADIAAALNVSKPTLIAWGKELQKEVGNARTLRLDDTLRTTRLIALSGYAQPEDRKLAREAGFDAHLAKPPPLDELEEVMAAMRS